MTLSFLRLLAAGIATACLAVAAAASAAEIDVRRLGPPESERDLLCDRCAAGDHLVSNGRIDLVIGASHRRDQSFYKFATADALGSIVFCRPTGSGARGDVMVGSPYLRIGNTTRHIAYDAVELQRTPGPEGGVRVEARALYQGDGGARVGFVGRYEIARDSDKVGITLTVTNLGAEPLGDLVYSLYFDPHQVYDFSPSDSDGFGGLPFRVYPRSELFMGWVDRTSRRSSTDFFYGWDGGMILPDPHPIRLPPGKSDSRSYAFFAAREPAGLLREVYEELGVPSRRISLDLESASKQFIEVVARESRTSAIFFRAFFDRPEPMEIELPDGDYVIRANFFPGIAECTLGVSEAGGNACRLQDPPLGKLRVRILDAQGDFVPGKVSFHGLAPTRSPYFRPENPAYDDGYWEAYKNSVFPGRAGSQVDLPIGSYRVVASRGPEHSIDEKSLEIGRGESRDLVLRIERVIDRPDLISIDSHLHTLESDGAVRIEEKIRALVAEGVDVAIATDHNYPVDYTPALRDLALEEYLSVYAGAEVTVPERLDYNTYPMAVRAGEFNHGAIDALSTNLSRLFAASRSRDPGVILQINHPRSWQFDYFTWHGLDPESAAFAREGFDLSFDVLEVVNGADYDTPNNRATLRDWLNLLRRGYFFPLVGTSDSHEIDKDEPGYSRTYVYWSDPSGAELQIRDLMQRVREGRSFASNGPILDLSASGGARPGDTLTSPGGEVEVGIDVWSAPWMEASEIRLYVNGEPRSVLARTVSDPKARHLRADLKLDLDRDAYLVAEVRGDRSLAPVVQPRGREGSDEGGVLPYALSNPIFIDVDGNGRFDPPLPHEIELRPR